MASNIKDLIKITIRDLSKEYDQVAEESRVKFLRTLKPTEKVPDNKKRVYFDDDKNELDNKVFEAKQKIHEYINSSIKKINSKTTEAPSEEALRAIEALKLTNSHNIDDYNAMLEKYGDNILSYKAIRKIAYDNDIKTLPDNEHVNALENAQRLDKELSEHLTSFNIINHNSLEPWNIAGYEKDIDDFLEDD